MDDKYLLELVRNHPELYDSSDKRYREKVHKKKVWLKIGHELGYSARECEIRWISLRDQLRKALKLKRLRLKQGNKRVGKWRHEDEMSFIIPFLKERTDSSNLCDTDDESIVVAPELPVNNIPKLEKTDEQNDESEIITGVITDINPDINNEASEDRHRMKHRRLIPFVRPPVAPVAILPKLTRNHPLDHFPHSAPCASSSHSFTFVDPLSHFAPESPQQSTGVISQQDCKECVSRGLSCQAASSVTDAIDAFFNGLAVTVKQFSPYYQNVAKSRLFSIVNELELTQIQHRESSQGAKNVSGESFQRQTMYSNNGKKGGSRIKQFDDESLN